MVLAQALFRKLLTSINKQTTYITFLWLIKIKKHRNM